MARHSFRGCLGLGLLVATIHSASAAEPKAVPAETLYLTFQVQTGFDVWAGPRAKPGRLALDKPQLEEFVRSLTKALGTTGDVCHTTGTPLGTLKVPESLTSLAFGDQGRRTMSITTNRRCSRSGSTKRSTCCAWTMASDTSGESSPTPALSPMKKDDVRCTHHNNSCPFSS